jgi:phage terminase large subunit-like protein
LFTASVSRPLRPSSCETRCGVFRKKLAYPDLKRAVREQNRLFKATSILIEDKASGTQLIQDLIEEGLSKVVSSHGPPSRSFSSSRE